MDCADALPVAAASTPKLTSKWKKKCRFISGPLFEVIRSVPGTSAPVPKTGPICKTVRFFGRENQESETPNLSVARTKPFLPCNQAVVYGNRWSAAIVIVVRLLIVSREAG